MRTTQTVFLGFALLLMIPAAAFPAEKPNIVFMMADNLGFGDVGVYGGGELRGAPTPAIREGKSFR